MKEDIAIKQNIRSHDQVAGQYDAIHQEIFNDREQQRLFDKLKQAKSLIQTGTAIKAALDFGCGSGNLTGHLLKLDFQVTAADLSEKFLQLIKEKFGTTNLETTKINGKNLANFNDNTFDLTGTYSVLHHIPDYLEAVEEMIRVTKVGGVIFIDHEVVEEYWQPMEEYINFLQQVTPPAVQTWKKYFKLSNYILKFRQLLNPRYQEEGDIHVWADDHIEWNKIINVLEKNNCEILLKEDYLLFKNNYNEEVYSKYQNKLVDTRLLIARKK